MKNSTLPLLAFAVLSLFVATSAQAAGTANNCAAQFKVDGGRPPTITTWRTDKSVSQTRADGTQVRIPTDAAREQVLQRHARQIHQAIYVIGDGPWTYFAGAPGLTLKQTQYPEYMKGKYPKYDVQTGGEAVMRATFSLGPSGHVGRDLKQKIANAEEYAKTDRIFLWVEVDGKRVDLVRELKSMGMETYVDVEFPLVKGKEVKLFYARYGKNDPLYIDRINGFMEGRVFGFTWDGN